MHQQFSARTGSLRALVLNCTYPDRNPLGGISILGVVASATGTSTLATAATSAEGSTDDEINNRIRDRHNEDGSQPVDKRKVTKVWWNDHELTSWRYNATSDALTVGNGVLGRVGVGRDRREGGDRGDGSESGEGSRGRDEVNDLRDLTMAQGGAWQGGEWVLRWVIE